MLLYERTHKELVQLKQQESQIKQSIIEAQTALKLVQRDKERLEKVMLEEMKRDGVQSHDMGSVVYRWQKGKESVKFACIEALPEDFVKIKKEPNKEKLKAFLKDGNQCNYATLEIGADYLVTKGK